MPHHREVHPEDKDGCYNCKLLSTRWNGLASMKNMREAGVTGRSLAKENIENFRKEKGYDPVSASERWI